MKHYQHLCNEERFYIWHALREGNTQQQIAKVLGRHPSTLSREIKRMLWSNGIGHLETPEAYCGPGGE